MLINYKGFGLAVLSMIFAGAGSLFLKESVQKIGAASSTIFYYLFGLIFVVAASLVFRKFSLPSGELIWVLAASLCLSLSVFCFNSSLYTMNVSTSATIYSLGFVVTIIGAVVFYKEQLVLYDYIAAALAVAAVLTYGLKPT